MKDQIDEVTQTPNDADGEDCELHIYESRYDTRGSEILLRVGVKSKIELEANRSHRACLVLTRHYSRKSTVVLYTTLKVQSQHIIKALKDAVGSYPEENFYSNPVHLDSEPPKCLFHYREELRAYANESNDAKIKDHVNLCLKYMEKTMPEEVRMIQQAIADPLAVQLDEKNLWIIFKPGCLVYERQDGIDVVSRLDRIVAREDERTDKFLGWDVLSRSILYNGESFGHIERRQFIHSYDGRKLISHLPVFPLLFHPEADRIQRDTEERGRKYLSYCGVHHAVYNGLALFQDLPVGYPMGPVQFRRPPNSSSSVDRLNFAKIHVSPSDTDANMDQN